MRFHIVSVAARLPIWVEQGVATYTKRIPSPHFLKIHNVKPADRTRADVRRWKEDEWDRLRAVMPKVRCRVALDENGELWSTAQLAERIDRWRADYGEVVFLIGGPDGLAETCLESVQLAWSLSRLTLPHGLVRIILAEQIYRAWSVLNGHPYHRD